MGLKYSEKYKEIGKKIAEYRKKQNITQEELANKVRNKLFLYNADRSS